MNEHVRLMKAYHAEMDRERVEDPVLDLHRRVSGNSGRDIRTHMVLNSFFLSYFFRFDLFDDRELISIYKTVFESPDIAAFIEALVAAKAEGEPVS